MSPTKSSGVLLVLALALAIGPNQAASQQNGNAQVSLSFDGTGANFSRGQLDLLKFIATQMKDNLGQFIETTISNGEDLRECERFSHRMAEEGEKICDYLQSMRFSHEQLIRVELVFAFVIRSIYAADYHNSDAAIPTDDFDQVGAALIEEIFDKEGQSAVLLDESKVNGTPLGDIIVGYSWTLKSLGLNKSLETIRQTLENLSTKFVKCSWQD